MDYFADDPRTNVERLNDGDLYIADAQTSVLTQRAATLTREFERLLPLDGEAAMQVLQDLVGELGEGSFLRPPFFVDLGYNLKIGANSFANFNLMALDVAPITIGDDVLIGPNVQLLTPTHPLEPTPRRDKLEGGLPITIGNNVWLGGGVIVCPGVTIGENTVVGAGAVVTKDLPANVLAVGNPAGIVRELEDGELNLRPGTRREGNQ